MTLLESTAKRIGDKTAVEPMVIIAVISALTQLLTLCLAPEPSPEEIVEHARNPTLRETRVMKRSVRQELRAKGELHKFGVVWAEVEIELAGMTTEKAKAYCGRR